MQTLNLRYADYSNDSVYFLTIDDNLIHKSEMTQSDEPKLKILVNSFWCGTLEAWEDNIKVKAINFLKQQ